MKSSEKITSFRLRRGFIAAALAVGALEIAALGIAALAPSRSFAQTAGQKPASDDSATSIVIHQVVDFMASPERLYEALLDSAQFSKFSGRAASIDRATGGEFSLFDGHIVGRNLELVPDQRIVQAWRVVDWPAGVYSIVRFELIVQKSGTRLVFDHIGFPAGKRNHLASGWEENYWSLLKKYLR